MIRIYPIFMLLFAALAAPAETLYVIGNSLSCHPPREEIGWNRNHGMAASALERDYVHLLRDKLRLATGKEYQIIVTTMQNEPHMGGLPAEMPEQADVILLQVGDNYQGTLDEAALEARYAGMLTTLRQRYPRAIVVAVGPWKSGPEAVFRRGAEAAGVPFAAIKHLGDDPAMSATGYSSWAVNWHPGDAGMAAIAEAVWRAVAAGMARPEPVSGVTGIIPEPQQVWVPNEAPFAWQPGTALRAPADADPALRHAIELLAGEFRTIRQIELPVRYDLPAGEAVIRIAADDGFAVGAAAPEQGYDAYILVATAKGVELAARDRVGLFYGVQTLRQLFDAAGGAPAVAIRDWADQRWRVVYGPPWTIPGFIDKLARLKINMCIVESRWDAGGNWWFNPHGVNREQGELLFELGRLNNIEAVPLIQGGGWAYGVIDQNPNCAEGIWAPEAVVTFAGDEVEFPERNVIHTPTMPVIVSDPAGQTVYGEGRDYEIVPGVTVRPFKPDNAPWRLRRLAGGAIPAGASVKIDYNYMNFSPHQTPYCPLEPLTYEILDRTLRNAVAIYQPRYIHIGHDEVIYRNRCRRCVQSGKSKAQLAGEDLRWWTDRIQALDPEITVMIWDDLVRSTGDGPEILQYLPQEVVICPWIYTANAEADAGIVERCDWFLARNRRQTLGTAAGYFHENIPMWRNALRSHRGNPGNWGLMFSHWGESIGLWGALPTAAQVMWSADRLNPEELGSLYKADYGVHRFGWRAALEFELQRSAFAKKVNAGDDDLAEVEKTVAGLIAGILRHRLPGFEGLDNPFPEATASQLRRLVDWYRAMLIYRDLPEKGSAEELFATLARVAPERREEWQRALAAWTRQRALPPPEEIFGVDIKARSPFAGTGRLYPVEPGKVIDVPGIREVEFNGVRDLAGVEFSGAAPGMYRVVAAAPDGSETVCFETVIGDGGAAVGHWEPIPAVKVRIHSNEPKENIGATIGFLARKPPPSVENTAAAAGDFITRNAAFAVWPTRAALSVGDGVLKVEFICSDDPARSPVTHHDAVWEDDCVEFFLREDPEAPGFVHVAVNAAGRSEVILHDRALPPPEVRVESSSAPGEWGCVITIPLGGLRGDPAQWSVNFARNYPGLEISSWAELPETGAFWFLQPEAFIPVGE